MTDDRNKDQWDDLPLPMLEALASQRHIGLMHGADGIAEVTGSCGDSMLVQIKVTGGAISEVSSLVRGCIYTTACATALGDLARGLNLDEAVMLEPEELSRALGGLPDDHMHCARLALNALGEAILYWHAASGAGAT